MTSIGAVGLPPFFPNGARSLTGTQLAQTIPRSRDMRTLGLQQRPQSQIRGGLTMDSSKDPVWILFITDIKSRDKLLKYSSGSQWEVDPVTAAALILAGAAVRMPARGTAAPADAVVEIPTCTAGVC